LFSKNGMCEAQRSGQHIASGNPVRISSSSDILTVEGIKGLTRSYHGTLECRDLQASRRFYEELLGLDVVQTSHMSMMVRLGGNNTIAVVQSPRLGEAPLLSHNGLDVATRAEVDQAHALVTRHKEEYGVDKITQPVDQHGSYSFYFTDLDGNWWEILTNPPGGYGWLFERGDDAGKGHLDRNVKPEGHH